MSDVLADLLGALKDGRAGRQPDPSSTRGSNPREAAPQGAKSSGPLHRISEASVTGTATVEPVPDAVNLLECCAVTTAEQESPEAWIRRDALDAECGAPAAPWLYDSDDLEAENKRRARHEAKRQALGLTDLQILDEATGEVWEIPGLTPAQKRLVAKSKKADAKPPIVKLAEEPAPENPEPVTDARTPGERHPWRRYKQPAEAGERRAA